MFCMLDKKGLSVQVKNKLGGGGNPNHPFILGTPAYMVANNRVKQKQSG
jgi:hypothetical protein